MNRAFSVSVKSALGYDASGRLVGWFALAMVGGAATFFSLRMPPPALFLLAASGGILVAGLGLIATIRRGQVFPQQALLLVLACGLGIGFLASAVRTATTTTVMLDRPLEQVLVEGWITGLDPHPDGARLRILTHAITDLASEDVPGLVRMTQKGYPSIAPGRFVRCYGLLRPVPDVQVAGDYDFRRQAFFDGLGGVGYVFGQCRPGALGYARGKGLWLRHVAVRRALAEHVADAAGPRAGGFAAAMVSGDRSLMREDDREALRASGLAHLLAISGLHLGLVGGMVYLVFRRGLALVEPIALRIPVQKPAALAALAILAAYFVMSGMSVATQRAFIMACVFFGAILLDRPAFTLRALALAMILVVLWRPETVLSPGFQMSFAATGALIAAFAAWRRIKSNRDTVLRGRFSSLRRAGLAILVSSTVGAVATAPFAIYHFDRAAPLGVLANLAAMPIVSLVCVPGAALAMIGAPFGLDGLGLRTLGFGLEGVLGVAHYFADAGPLTGFASKPLPVASLVLMALAIAVISLHAGRGRVLAAVLVAGAVWVWWRKPTELVIATPDGAIYAHSVEGWTFADTGSARGLPPLRFADLDADTDCTEACRIVLRRQASILTLIPPQSPTATTLATVKRAKARDIKVPLPHSDASYHVVSANGQVRGEFRPLSRRKWSASRNTSGQAPQAGPEP